MHEDYAFLLTCITKRCGDATKEAIRDDGTSRNLIKILFLHEDNKQGLVRRVSPGWVVGKMREKVDS